MCTSLSSTSFTKQGLVCMILEKQQLTNSLTTPAFLELVKSIKQQSKTHELLNLKKQDLVKLANQAKNGQNWGSYSRYIATEL